MAFQHFLQVIIQKPLRRGNVVGREFLLVMTNSIAIADKSGTLLKDKVAVFVILDQSSGHSNR